MTKARAILVVTVLLTSVVLVSGCQAIAEKATEKAIEGATGGKVDIKDEGVTVEGENGEQVAIGEQVDVPDDFPKDVPVYEGNVLGAYSDDKAWTLSIETKDDPKTVIDFYSKKLEDEDWAKVSSADTGDGAMYSAKKGEKRQCTIVAATSGGETEGKTSITVSVTQE